MPALAGPALTSPLGAPPTVFVSALTLDDQPPPTPPDPVEWDEPVVSAPPRIQVLVGRAMSREVIGELTTADVEDWDRDVELFAGYTAAITASSTDPLWEVLATPSSPGTDGRRKYEFDPAGYVVWIYEDGYCVWTGVFHQTVDIGGGRVLIPAQGPQEVLSGRILGRAEQYDNLQDRGSFETYTSIAQMEADGWDFGGVEAELVSGGVRGAKCLRVRGVGTNPPPYEGWVRSPRVTLQGADGIGKAVSGSVFGKWDITIPVGAVVVKTYTQRTDSLAPTNELVTDEAAGVRPDDSSGWTEMPVLSGGRMSAQAVPHRCWVSFKSFAGVWSYYDLATLRQSIQTGFPPGVEADLAEYIDRIHASLTSRDVERDGSPTGLTVRLVSLTGVTASMRWLHEARLPVTEVVGQVLNMDGGPECRITTNWVWEVHARLGSERPDVLLSAHEVVAPKWSVDPKAKLTDFVVDTGRGDGVAWIASPVSTPFDPGEWRNLAVVQGPNDRTLNELDSWALARSRAAFCLQVTAEAQVRRDIAAQIHEGDVVFAFLEDGSLASPRRMRVLRVRDQPKAGLATISLGAVDE